MNGLQFSIQIFTDMFSKLYNFMIDTKFFNISLFSIWIGSVIIALSVGLVLVLIQTRHGG